MDRHSLNVIVGVLLVGLFMLVLLRGSEDDWICQHGQWIKHGQPARPMPTRVCH